MHRILAFISVPIVAAMGLVTAPSASADTVSGGQLTVGTAVTASIAVDDREIAYTLAGTSGTHLALDASASSWGTGNAQLGVYQPGGEAALFCPLGNGPAACDLTLDSTGTWTVKVQPLDNAHGNVTFKVVADQNKGALLPGVASTVVIATKGQRANYTFTGVKGARSTIDISESDWGSGGADLQIVEPSGVVGVICPLTANSTCDFTPPVDGTWKAVVVPNAGSTGKATISLGADIAKGALTFGTPVTAEIKTRSTTVAYTFTATAGKRHLFSVTSTDWGTGTADLNIYQPDAFTR